MVGWCSPEHHDGCHRCGVAHGGHSARGGGHPGRPGDRHHAPAHHRRSARLDRGRALRPCAHRRPQHAQLHRAEHLVQHHFGLGSAARQRASRHRRDAARSLHRAAAGHRGRARAGVGCAPRPRDRDDVGGHRAQCHVRPVRRVGGGRSVGPRRTPLAAGGHRSARSARSGDRAHSRYRCGVRDAAHRSRRRAVRCGHLRHDRATVGRDGAVPRCGQPARNAAGDAGHGHQLRCARRRRHVRDGLVGVRRQDDPARCRQQSSALGGAGVDRGGGGGASRRSTLSSTTDSPPSNCRSPARDGPNRHGGWRSCSPSNVG